MPPETAAAPAQRVQQLAVPPAPAPNATTPSLASPLSLDAALQRAIADNPQRRIVAARLARAEAVIAERQAAFWPQVSLYTEHLQGESPSASLFKSIDQRRLDQRNVDFNRPGRFQNFETGIKANLQVFNGRRDTLRLQIAKHRRAALTHTRAEVINDLCTAVTETFCTILAAEETVATAKHRITLLREEVRMAKIRFEAGGTLKADVLSLQSRLSQAKSAHTRARARASSARAALAVLLDLPPDQCPDITGSPRLPVQLPATYHKARTYALNHHPALTRAREQTEQARLGLDLAWAAYLPRLLAQGKYYHDDPHMAYSRERENWTLGLVLDWQLFSGLSRQAKVEQARGRMAEVRARNRQTRQRILQNLKQDLAEREAARDRLQASRHRVEQASEALRLVRIRYQGGSATLTRFLSAELARYAAQEAETASRFDLLRIQAAIARDIGAWHRRFGSFAPSTAQSAP